MDEFIQSVYKLPYKDDWDKDGANLISEVVKNNACSLINELNQTYNFVYHIDDKSSNKFIYPQVIPIEDGTIDLLWYNSVANLIININSSPRIDFSFTLNHDDLPLRTVGQFHRQKKIFEFFKIFIMFYHEFINHSTPQKIRVS